MATRSHRIDTTHGVPAPVSLPEFRTLQEVIDMADKEDVDFSELSERLKSESRAAARVLREARSMGVGREYRVERLQHALALLGLRKIREILVNLKRDQVAAAVARNKQSTNRQIRNASAEIPHPETAGKARAS